MGVAGAGRCALPLLAVFSADAGLLRAATERWLSTHGSQLAAFGPYPFTFSDYYNQEMGAGLHKLIVVGATPVRAEVLADLKSESNRWEKEYAGAGGRPVNLDPGLCDDKRVVLATTKDAAHRLYLRDGIFAEVTLRYHTGSYQPEAWTYPDFRQPELLAFFNGRRPRVRALLATTEK